MEEENPESRYVYLHQALANQDQRILHAQEINVKGSQDVFFIFNRSLTQMFDIELRTNNHWAIGIICSNGEVLFADALYKNPPANFTEVVGDYYQEKFGRKLKRSNLINLSGRKNFPIQRDGSLCGLIVLMILVLSQHKSIIEMFKFNGYRLQVDDLLDLVFEPSYYQSYLRKIFQTAYSEGRLCITSFISSQGMEKLERKLIFLRKDLEHFGRRPCTEPNSFIKKPKSMKNNKSASAEEPRSMQNEKPKPPEQPQYMKKKKLTSPEQPIKKKRPSSPEQHKSMKKKKKTSPPKQPQPMQSPEQVETRNMYDVLIEDIDEDLSEDGRAPNIIDCPNLSSTLSRGKARPLDKEKEEKPAEKHECSNDEDIINEKHSDQMKETVSRDSILVSPNFIGTIQMESQKYDDKGRRNAIVDTDGYKWKRATNKNRKTVYKCSALRDGMECSAVKSIVKPFKKTGGGKLTIKYLAAHSCSTNELVDKEVEMDKAKNQPETEEPNIEEEISNTFDDSEDKQIEMDNMLQKSPSNDDMADELLFLGQLESPDKISDDEDVDSNRNKTDDLENCKSSEKEILDPDNSESELYADGRRKENVKIDMEAEVTNFKENYQEIAFNDDESQAPNSESDDSDVVKEVMKTQDECPSENDADDSLGNSIEDYSNDGTNADEEADATIFVEFPVGTAIQKYKLYQLENYPKHESKAININENVALIIGSEEKQIHSRGHLDGWSWNRMSKGVGSKVCIGTNNCIEKSTKGCLAIKRKWVCSGTCAFKYRFCCDYRNNGEKPSLVLLYSSQHNHPMQQPEHISLADCIESELNIPNAVKDRSENSPEIVAEALKVSQSKDFFPSISIDDNVIDEDSSDNKNEDNVIDEDNFIIQAIRANGKYNESKINFTSRTKIKSTEMTDTFHIIKKNKEERPFDVSQDGYYYNRRTTTKEFPAIFKKQQTAVYTCPGRMKCINSDCDIFKRLQCLSYIANKPSTSKKCLQCSADLILDQCSGKRWIISSSDKDCAENSKEANFIVAYYLNSHSCGQQDWVLDPSVIDDLSNLFKTNTSMTSAAAYSNLLNEKFNCIMKEENAEARRAHIEDLLAVVNAATFDHVPKNIKTKVVKAKAPHGSGIAAVIKLREKVTEAFDTLGVVLEVVIDSYICENEKCLKVAYSTTENSELVTECCGKPMLQLGPSVLVTSKEQMKVALEMSRIDGIFKRSTAFVDHQPGRCEPMNTFNCAMYDFTLKEMTSIFMSHCMSEEQHSVYFQFKLFNDVLERFSGSEAKFDPFGFCSDQGGGLICGLRLFYGAEKPHRSCRFHFIYSAYQFCGDSIGDHQNKIVFLKFIYALIDASTAILFNQVAEEFWNWIGKLESREKQLSNWWSWWFNCRTRWSNAFTSSVLSEVNLVEGLHAKYSKKNGLKNMSLLQSTISQIGDCLKYSNRLFSLASGKYQGRGPSKNILESRAIEKEMNKVKIVPLTTDALADVFKSLGLPVPDDDKILEDSTRTPQKIDRSLPKAFISSPLLKENSERGRVLNAFTPSPISKSTFHKKKVKFSTKSRKPGRPKGAKSKKYISQWSKEIDDIFEESDEEPDHLDDIGDDDTAVMISSFDTREDSIPNEIVFDIDMDSIDRRLAVDQAFKHVPDKNPTSNPKRKRQRLFDTIHFQTRKKRAFEEQSNYTIRKTNGYSFTLTKKNTGQIRQVEFNSYEILCSCEDFARNRYHLEKNEVCKHVALIVLKCNSTLCELYFGNSLLTTKDWGNLKSLLETYEPNRKIQNPNSLTVPDIPRQKKRLPVAGKEDLNGGKVLGKKSTLCFNNPGPFLTKEESLNAAPLNKWYAEKYSVGGHPSCRTCTSPIKQQQVCIR